MPMLKNQRWELFAQAIAKDGKTKPEAYLAAGYRCTLKSAWEQSSVLSKNLKVSARIAELQEAINARAVNDAGVTKSWVLKELADNVRLAKTQDGEGNWDGSVANRALELLGKELGMFVDRKLVKFQRIEDLSTEELQALLNDIDRDTAGSAAGETIN